MRQFKKERTVAWKVRLACVVFAACTSGANSETQLAGDIAAADAAFVAIESNAPTEVAGLSVSVGVGDKIVYQNAYGYADVENGVLADPQTRFRIYSTSKVFGAVTANGQCCSVTT